MSILAVHPLDTVRTRLQTAEPGRFKGALDVISKTAQLEGYAAFYKGMTPPLFAQGIQKATMFFAYGYAQRFFLQKNGGAGPLSIPQLLASGGFAGGVNSFVACPIELIRNRLQVQYGKVQKGAVAAAGEAAAAQSHTYTGPIDCFLKILRYEGPGAVYRGLFPMIMRDVPGVGAWYGTFELARRALTPPGKTQKDVSIVRVMASGALAGIGYWAVAFPQDAIKSVIQTQRTSASGRVESFFECGARLVRTEGLGRLYRGFSVAVVRGIPGASVTFLTYTEVRKRLD